MITAGHCSTDGIALPDIVRIGAQNVYAHLDGTLTQEINILSILKHPLYQSVSAYNDLALIKLSSNAMYVLNI